MDALASTPLNSDTSTLLPVLTSDSVWDDDNFDPDDYMSDRWRPTSSAQLGTASVIMFCLSNIFGVVMFLRLGWIVGQAGILQLMLMFTISWAVVYITVFSLSAIATNGVMKAGGAYYLISRALGPEFGGSIGLIFYGAQVAGCAVSLLGFGEALLEAVGTVAKTKWNLLLVNTITLVVITAICFVGAKLYTRASVVVFFVMMVALLVAFISFFVQPAGCTEGFTGLSVATMKANQGPHYSNLDDGGTGTYDFLSVFTILFPAVTGIMAGANMSGDLATPGKSVPLGTLSSMTVAVLVYLGFALLLSASVEWSTLHSTRGYTILSSLSVAPWLVTLGVFGAVLSSAMGAIIGAAKVLQAVARDDLLPVLSIFKKGDLTNDEPRRGVIFTAMITEVLLISTSQLNTLATYQTLFCLLSYAMVNLACFALSIQGSAGFRPTFRLFSWHSALLGAILSLTVMFATHPTNSAISLLLCGLLFVYIQYLAPLTTWGDISQSIIYHQVRKYLLRLDERRQHVKFWRPQILLLVRNPRCSLKLLHLANNLKKGGLLIIASVVIGDCSRSMASATERFRSNQLGWLHFISQRKLKGLTASVVATSLRTGVQNLMMCCGLGAVKPNTVMLGMLEPHKLPESSLEHMDDICEKEAQELREALAPFPPLRTSPSGQSIAEYVDMLKDLAQFGKSVIVARHAQALRQHLIGEKPVSGGAAATRRAFVDVWALRVFDDANSAEQEQMELSTNMSLLLAYSLKNTRGAGSGWKRWSRLRVNTVVRTADRVQVSEQQLKDRLRDCRIPCQHFRVFQMQDTAGLDGSFTLPSSRSGYYHRLGLIIQKHSDDAGILLVPLPLLPGGGYSRAQSPISPHHTHSPSPEPDWAGADDIFPSSSVQIGGQSPSSRRGPDDDGGGSGPTTSSNIEPCHNTVDNDDDDDYGAVARAAKRAAEISRTKQYKLYLDQLHQLSVVDKPILLVHAAQQTISSDL